MFESIRQRTCSLVRGEDAPSGGRRRQHKPRLASMRKNSDIGAMLRGFFSDSVHIAYIDVPPEGTDRGEPILLIHGFASNHRINWVGPRWVETLTRAGRRVVAFDNRGHGASQKLYAPHDYRSDVMARDAANLLAHLRIER